MQCAEERRVSKIKGTDTEGVRRSVIPKEISTTKEEPQL